MIDAAHLSEVFARFWGLFYLIFGSLFILSRQLGKTIELTDDRSFVIATGYSTLIMGLITVSAHNLWQWDWSLLITILGWTAILKSIHKIGFPESIQQQAQKFKKGQWISSLLLLGMAGFLIAKGFF